MFTQTVLESTTGVTDLIQSLPPVSQAVVFFVSVVSVAVIVFAVTDHSPTDWKWVVAATTGGFFLVDLLYIHPHVWNNVPGFIYWAFKPVFVGYGMFVVAWVLFNYTDISNFLTLLIAGLGGIVVLQIYYTVVPIPIVNGPDIQIDLAGNLTQGLSVHGFGLIVAFVIVLLGMHFYGSRSSDDSSDSGDDSPY